MVRGVACRGGSVSHRSSSSARREEVEAELSICICLKSRSDFISSYLSESMPLDGVRVRDRIRAARAQGCPSPCRSEAEVGGVRDEG
eukprot:scaffold46795_cov43-Phaeocystis_antarctica.AAC.1